MAEFLLLRESKGKQVVWIVEAKSSTPRPESQPNFDKFIAEIREKLINAFSLGWASCLRRHPQAKAELPENFKTLNLSQLDVKFVLVINGHKDAWLQPLQEALNKELKTGTAGARYWLLATTKHERGGRAPLLYRVR